MPNYFCSTRSFFVFIPLIAVLSAFCTTSVSAAGYCTPKTRFFLSNVTSAYYTLKNPVPEHLFGDVRQVRASAADLRAKVHPRVIFGHDEWNAITSLHAFPSNFRKPGSWSATLFGLSYHHSYDSSFVKDLADLEASGKTGSFTGKHREDFLSDEDFTSYRRSIKPLAEMISLSSETNSHAFFLCAFWVQVSRKQGSSSFLPKNASLRCRNAAVAWSKILLAHRTYYCTPTCTKDSLDETRSFIWNYNRFWSVPDDWYTCGASLALTYDVMYSELSQDHRTLIRSALSLLTAARKSWGTSVESDGNSPNAEIHPHRIFSNWATYHSNLYIAALSIEGEEGYIPYASRELQIMNKETSGAVDNAGLVRRFGAVIDAFFTHSIYPDGTSFEDGYTYHLALREGSFGLLARQRRVGGIFESPRFRNMVHAVLQQWEPWPCGELVGHASGGGLLYPSYVALIRYAYPNGVLSGLAWTQRFGKSMDNSKCRISWTQTMMQVAVLGGEHSKTSENIGLPDAPEHLPLDARKHFPLSFVAPRRGLVIMRGSISERAIYVHLDARPDSYFVGHDNADRGGIIMSALRQRWLDDHGWRENVDSRHHSLLHVDGLSQDVKAPSVTLIHAHEHGSQTGASAAVDLTYAGNVQWAKAWQGPNVGTGNAFEYSGDGKAHEKTYKFVDRESQTPWDLGWPMEDNATDIGFKPGMQLQGETDVGFRGIQEWRRPYRTTFLRHHVRSLLVLRSNPRRNDVGVAILVDSVDAGPGTHMYEEYLVLNDEVSLVAERSFCNAEIRMCKLVLTKTGREFVDLIVLSLGVPEFRLESFSDHRRIVLATEGGSREEFWIVMYPHEEGKGSISVKRGEDGEVDIVYDGEHRRFFVRKTDDIALEKGFPLKEGEPQERRGKNRPSTSKPIQFLNSKSLEKYRDRTMNSDPIPAIYLPFRRVLRLGMVSMTSDRSKFFHKTKSQWQAVVRIRSWKIEKAVDRISTCRKGNNVSTKMTLFDCGEGKLARLAYKKRKCAFLGESNKGFRCNEGQGTRPGTNFAKLLQGNKKYYVVLSMNIKGKGKSPHLVIMHKMRRIMN